MKILFLGNATSWHVAPWVNYFTKDHEISLLSFIEPHKHNKDLNNTKIIEVKGLFGFLLLVLKIKKDFYFKLNRLVSIPIAAFKLFLYIKKNEIQVIHAHSVFYGFLAFFASRNVPVVFTPMGSDVLVNPKKSSMYLLMTKLAFKRANMVTGDSYILQKTGISYGAEKNLNFVIQNGVDKRFFFPDKKDDELLKKYRIEDEIIFYSPRQVEELYNIDIIIDSLHKISVSGYKFKCLFSYVPESSYLNLLKDNIRKFKLESNIVWLPLLNHKEMAKHYNLCDLVISVPSSDSSPRSVYEAAFCRKPIVVTDLPWSHEFFKEKDSLVRIPVRDSLSLANVLDNFINDREKFKILAKNSNLIAVDHFDYYKNMKKMEDLLYSLINE